MAYHVHPFHHCEPRLATLRCSVAATIHVYMPNSCPLLFQGSDQQVNTRFGVNQYFLSTIMHQGQPFGHVDPVIFERDVWLCEGVGDALLSERGD